VIALLAGNARILLSVNERGGWEQLYYPYPGQHQQLRQVRVGLYDRDDNKLAWLDHEGPAPLELGYVEDTQVARTRSECLGLDLLVDNVVHPDRDLIVRRITLSNPSASKRSMSIFHYQSMQLAGSAYRETAYWDPTRRGLHHYKLDFHMQFVGEPTFDAFSCGEHTLKGLAGSYVDAEDGKLMGNLVSHGSADSIGQWNVDVPANGKASVYLYVLIGRTREDVHRLYDGIKGRDPAMFVAETAGYWQRWLGDRKIQPSFDLSPLALDVYRRSLFVLQSCAARTGSIIASPDSFILREGGDGYEYCWWRDGAYVSQAMSEVGMYKSARAFLDFAAQCQESNGSFLHRHFPNGDLGPTWHPPEEIQLDQTASVIEAVHAQYRCSGDLEELLGYWDMVRNAADFIMGYIDEDGLPRPSYDLWEERYASSTYATGMVVKALDSAARIAKALGRRYDFWSRSADTVRQAALGTLWRDGQLLKSAHPEDATIDASTLLVELFPPGDDRYRQLADTVEQALWQPGIGGIARYQGDTYFGKENPWIICTLWLARMRLRLGDVDRCRELIEWVAQRASSTHLLPEQADAISGAKRGVLPLVWSHSTYIQTVMAYSKHPARLRAAAAPEVRSS
jgi:oligosaccharide amylase